MSIVVTARNLRVDYERLTALADFDLTLEAGHLVGLVGPNGSGKTTLLRAMAGLQPLTAGEVRVLDDRVEPGRPEVLSRIGFTPDTPALYDSLTVEDFLDFIGRSYRLPRSTIEERTDFWLEQLWLADRRDVRVGTLSRGMKQRLAVARTLLPDPTVILLDEPAAGLDPAGRVEFRRLLASLRDQGKALIISSHILADLHEYCTHIAIMERGRCRSYGTVAAVVAGRMDHRCQYQGTLTRTQPDARELLAAIENVTAVRVDGRVFTLEYDQEPTASAVLLRKMLEQGLEVASFAPVAVDLEQAYLRTGIRQVD
jgi:ABC-2 type transport system ATP-binding protein